LVVLVQPPHFVNDEPLFAVAVNVTMVPAAYVAQLDPQVAPAGFTVTVPAPVLPAVVPYVRSYVVVVVGGASGTPASIDVPPVTHCL
jgi:hypothetical protein